MVIIVLLDAVTVYAGYLKIIADPEFYGLRSRHLLITQKIPEQLQLCFFKEIAFDRNYLTDTYKATSLP